MLKRSVCSVVVLMALFAASSALAARVVHSARPAAQHRRTRHRRVTRGPRHKPGTAVHRGRSSSADIPSTRVLLGDEQVEWQYDALNAGQAEAFRLQANATGPAGFVHVFLGWGNTATTVIAGLYSTGSNGQPGSLLSTGAASGAKRGAWATVPIASTELLAGRTYWLAILGEGGTLRYRDRWRGRCPSETSAQVTLSSLPVAWTTGASYADCPVSAYVTPTPTAPGSPSTGPAGSGTQTGPSLPAAPSSSVPPAVTGSAKGGQMLSASTGTWTESPTSYAYEWEDCGASGEGCANIGGAGGASYRLAAGDVGHRVRVVVTASNPGGSSAASSAATNAVLPAPPANTAPPSVSGTAQEGQTLSASTGTWSESPTSLAYQWEDCNALGEGCLNIAGATASTYKLTASDVAATVRVVVTAANGGGSTAASSAATAVVVSASPVAPTNTVLPSVSGTAREGQTLSASTGTWSGSPTSYVYRWQDCNASGETCSSIAGATASSYKLAAGDVGHTVRVVVKASNAGGSGEASSVATAVVVAQPPAAPANSVLPSVSGTAQEGQTLSASSGTWSGSPTSYAYQWQDCNTAGEACSSIAGATASTRVLAPGDVGHTVRVVVKASNAGGSGEASSAVTAVVVAPPPAAPANAVLPSVSGTAQEGQTLSASTGTWSGSPTSYAYQWQDCNGGGEACSSIAGATASTRVLGSSDVGHAVRVVVKASNAGGSGEASSAATAVVAAPPPTAPANTVLPSVTGTAQEGQTLTAATGTWSGSPTSYAYQWQDCNALGEGCVSIAGATASTYKLTASDVTATVRVVVTATNAGGSTPASSATSGVVLPALPVAPVDLVPPPVTGTAQEGQTLSVSTGTWAGSPTSYAYQWQDCNAGGEACSSIAGATASSYKLAGGDVGHTVRVMVKASNAGGSGEASSAATAVVVAPPPAAPTNTVAPSVTGAAQEGQTLSASTGTWSGSPTSYAYQWRDCNTVGEACSSIAGATGSSYKLAGGDVGHTVRVMVKASNAGGSGEASSMATAIVVVAPPAAPANTVLPSVSGTAQEGQTLSASTGTWSGSPTSYAYQWQDCNTGGEACSSIAGATASTRVLAPGDVGHTVRVVVKASNAGGSGEASSAATAVVVVPPPAAPTNTVAPSVTGTAQEGQTLSASPGTWSGGPTSYAYQWQDCNALGEGCVSIAGATSVTYKLTASDVAATVRVVVTATNAGGSTPASSVTTAIVVVAPPAAPANTVLPSVSGTAQEGQTLSASTGTWSGSPTSYAYQWQDCNTAGEACSSIAGATASSYKLAANDVGHTVRVAVKASNAGGSGEASSASTAVVVAAPPPAPTNTVLPSVSGTAQEGQTLSASTGTWSGSPTSYAYQWQDCNTAGEACSSIAGATASSYKLAANDVGHTVRVSVTAHNAGGSAAASSVATGMVLPAAPANTVLPSVTGTAQEGQTLNASSGTWTGNPTAYDYRWEDCNAAEVTCTLVSGATQSSYTIAAGDVGYRLRVVVTANNAGGSTAASSAMTAVATAEPPGAPTNSLLPSVSGNAEEGQTLSASAGTWTGSPTSYAYQWEDCNTAGEACSTIPGATASSYLLTAADVGHTSRVAVTAINAGGSTGATSAATAVVAVASRAVPVNTALPVVSGTVEEGQTLSASVGTWTGNPTSYSYQWEACNVAGEGCSAISGQTGSSYTPVAGQVGFRARVLVTASNTAGSGASSSAATATVWTPRWYAANSLWNTPIAANPAIAPNDASLIAQWSETAPCEVQGSYCMQSLVEWTPTVWYASANTPMVEVQIDYPTCDASSVEAPIPAGALPDPSSEGHMIVMGSDGTEYGFYQMQSPNQPPKSHYSGDGKGCPTVGAWTAADHGTSNWKTGLGVGGGMHASETPEGAGLITQQDLEMPAGSTWPHALAITYGPTCKKSLSWCGAVLPATQNGGTCEVQSRCLPEGARLQLEPTINCSTWPSIKYEWQRQWCRTWETYGVIIVDTKGTGLAGGAAQFTQNPLSWKGGFKPPWDSDPEIPANPDGEKVGVMPNDLLSHFRVLAW